MTYERDWRWLTRRGAMALGVLAAVASSASEARAFRTTADTEGFTVGVPVRWSGGVRWRTDAAGVDGLDASRVGLVAQEAWAAWAATPCAHIEVTQAPDGADTSTPDGVVTIRALGAEWAARGYPSDVPARTEVAYAETAAGWVITDADVFLNDSAFELIASGDGTLLLAVLTHEFGHVLGLEHCCGRLEGAPECLADSICGQSTMYPHYAPETQSRVGPDDAAGLCWLYPADPCASVVCDRGHSCAMGTCQPDVIMCTTGADCPTGQICQRGACQLPMGVLGDPCIEGAECALGICEAGRCSASCSERGALCAHGYECDGRLCRPFLAELGDTCTTSADCTGGECLGGAAAAPVCTRSCGGGCPGPWSCVDVASESVCRPPPSPSCALQAGRPSGAAALLVSCLAALAGRARRTRHRWTSQSCLTRQR